MPKRDAKPLKLSAVVAERSFALFRQDGSAVPVSVRIGKPYKATISDFRCPVQITGIGDERVAAPWGEDPFVALQYAIDLIGLLLDRLVQRENLEIRFRSDRSGWIWRYPPH